MHRAQSSSPGLRRVNSSPQLRRIRRQRSLSPFPVRAKRKELLPLFAISCVGIFCCIATLVLSVVEIEENPIWDHDGDRGYGLLGRKVVVVSPRESLLLWKHRSESARKETMPASWKRGPLAIFYNIYIPTSDVVSEVTNAVDIVKEQIGQIAASPACRQPLTLYYSIIDNAAALNATVMEKLCVDNCPNLKCKLLKVYKTGSETVTLRQLHGFCRKYPHYRVTYLHTKGSFHVSIKNTNWRRLLTAAAISPECVNPPDATCNLCGLQFFTQFTFFVPGNMFTASCDYVQKLLPFQDDIYMKAREKVVEELLLLKLRNKLKSTLLWDQRDFLGLDRYADEHWIGSHPDLIPCDVDPVGKLDDVFRGKLKETEFDWAMGPRNIGICGGINDRLQTVVRSDPDLRRREILLLPGLIVKWFALYKRVPDPTSWVWEFFPDGDFWLEGVRQYGPDVVDVLTDRYRTSLDGSRIGTAFAPSNLTNARVLATSQRSIGNSSSDRISYSDFKLDLEIDPATSPGFAIFYHVAVPNKKDGTLSSNGVDSDRQLRDVAILVNEQLEIVIRSFAASRDSKPVTLFYNVAGEDLLSNPAMSIPRLVSNKCGTTSNVMCRFMNQFDRNYEGETLRQLHQFCQQYPSYRVSYLHNQGPVQLRTQGGNAKLIRHMTLAVTSEQCLQPESHACNVCGLIFYTMWSFFFPGNMFVASCEYVNKLIPPDDFQVQMKDFVGKLLLQRLRSSITTNVFPDRMDYFGLDQYSTDHWIGSHPSLDPCDLSNSWHGVEYWREEDRPTSAFNWSMAPRQKGAPFDYRWSTERRVLDSDSLRRREYFFLAGHILKWFALYKEASSPFSWTWWKLPDGLVWLKGVHDYGANAVDKLTAEYAGDGL